MSTIHYYKLPLITYMIILICCKIMGAFLLYNNLIGNITPYVSSGGGGGGGGGGSSGNSLSSSKASASMNSDGSYNDITFTINKSSSSNSITAIKNVNTVLVKDKDYTVDNNKITIKGTYLATLPQGDTKLTVDMNSGTDPVFTVTILAKSEVPDVVDTTTPDQIVGQNMIVLTLGSLSYMVNNATKTSDALPTVKDSRTYVPLRIISESLGANVQWDNATKTVTITDNGNTVVIKIGSSTYTVNGQTKTMDAAGYIDGNRTMVPIRFIAEGLGAKVDWDNQAKKVTITR